MRSLRELLADLGRLVQVVVVLVTLGMAAQAGHDWATGSSRSRAPIARHLATCPHCSRAERPVQLQGDCGPFRYTCPEMAELCKPRATPELGRRGRSALVA